MKLIIYTDGGARGNPGPAGIGVAVFSPPPGREGGDEEGVRRGRLLRKYTKFLGERTNNEAEYEGVIAALEIAQEMGASEVEVRLDSELVARQLRGIYRAKNHRMQEMVLRVRNLETKFKKVSYKNIPREKNTAADKLVNEAIDKHG